MWLVSPHAHERHEKDAVLRKKLAQTVKVEVSRRLCLNTRDSGALGKLPPNHSMTRSTLLLRFHLEDCP